MEGKTSIRLWSAILVVGAAIVILAGAASLTQSIQKSGLRTEYDRYCLAVGRITEISGRLECCPE